MARRSRGRSADASDVANLFDELLLPVEPEPDPVTMLDEFLGPELPHDRRRFHFGEPERYFLTETPPSVRSGDAKPAVSSPVSRMKPHKISFGEPLMVAICHRRKVRREVMHALGHTRRRGRGGGRRRLNWRSYIKC